MTESKLIASVELRLRPNVRQITSATRLIADVCAELTVEECSSRVVLATHELLENLAKYALDECPSFGLRVTHTTGDEGNVLIETQNLAAPAHLSKLGALLAVLGGSTEPREAYRTLMADSATRREGSGLGLARIRAEADLQLSHRTDSNQLTLLAFGSMPLRNAR